MTARKKDKPVRVGEGVTAQVLESLPPKLDPQRADEIEVQFFALSDFERGLHVDGAEAWALGVLQGRDRRKVGAAPETPEWYAAAILRDIEAARQACIAGNASRAAGLALDIGRQHERARIKFNRELAYKSEQQSDRARNPRSKKKEAARELYKIHHPESAKALQARLSESGIDAKPNTVNNWFTDFSTPAK